MSIFKKSRKFYLMLAATALMSEASSAQVSNVLEIPETQSPFEKQVVFLDFNVASTPTFISEVVGSDEVFIFNDHIFTSQERNAIQANMVEDYASFNVEITQSPPTEGEFTTIFFGDIEGLTVRYNPNSSRFSASAFGFANALDFNNRNLTDTAIIDMSIWEAIAQFDPTGDLFTLESGMEITTTLKDAVSKAVIAHASNAGSHELGHLMGLRHHDGFGPIGQGINPVTPAPASFSPLYTGRREAVETSIRIMSSPNFLPSSNLSLELLERSFSERSSIKLSFIEQGRPSQEDELETLDGGGLPTRSVVPFREVLLPNRIENGVNDGNILMAKTALLQGSISELNEVDIYTFEAESGDIYTFELASSENSNIEDVISSFVQVLFQDEEGNISQVDSNFHSFEGFDSYIIDLQLPGTGTYFILVSAPETNFFTRSSRPGLVAPGFFERSLDELGILDQRTGDYDLLIYSCRRETCPIPN